MTARAFVVLALVLACGSAPLSPAPVQRAREEPAQATATPPPPTTAVTLRVEEDKLALHVRPAEWLCDGCRAFHRYHDGYGPWALADALVDVSAFPPGLLEVEFGDGILRDFEGDPPSWEALRNGVVAREPQLRHEAGPFLLLSEELPGEALDAIATLLRRVRAPSGMQRILFFEHAPSTEQGVERLGRALRIRAHGALHDDPSRHLEGAILEAAVSTLHDGSPEAAGHAYYRSLWVRDALAEASPADAVRSLADFYRRYRAQGARSVEAAAIAWLCADIATDEPLAGSLARGALARLAPSERRDLRRRLRFRGVLDVDACLVPAGLRVFARVLPAYDAAARPGVLRRLFHRELVDWPPQFGAGAGPFHEGDVLTRVAGRWIPRSEQVFWALAGASPGERFAVEVRRLGGIHRARLRMPSLPEPSRRRVEYGIEVLSQGLSERFTMHGLTSARTSRSMAR